MQQRMSRGRLLCGAAVGVTGDMMERVEALVKAQVDVITTRYSTWTFKRCYRCS